MTSQDDNSKTSKTSTTTVMPTTPETTNQTKAAPDTKSAKANPKFQQIITALEGFSIKDLSALSKEIQSYFDIVPMIASGGGVGGAEEKASENVDVILTESGQSKIALIKALGVITGKGLMDAKKMIENLPVTIAQKKPVAEAENLKKQLEEAGGLVTLK